LLGLLIVANTSDIHLHSIIELEIFGLSFNQNGQLLFLIEYCQFQ